MDRIVRDLLERAETQGLRVIARGEKLTLEGPRRLKDLAQEIIARKAEVLAALAERTAGGVDTSTQPPETAEKTRLCQGDPSTQAAAASPSADCRGLSHDLVPNPEALARGRERAASGERLDRVARLLDVEALYALAADPGADRQLRIECRLELHKRSRKADSPSLAGRLMVAEQMGLIPYWNQTVVDMFSEARARFGSRDVEETSLTTWLRRHAPAVAALWPEASLTASWYDWRQHVGREHMARLDEAFAAVTRTTIAPSAPTAGGGHG